MPVPCRCGRSFLFKTELYGIKSALPGRQHERGFPLSNSPQRRGPAPHTPRQRFAAAPRPAPGAGPVETPRRHPQDQLSDIISQTQTWTHATPHYSTLLKAITYPGKTTDALSAGKPGAALHGSFLTRSGPSLTVRVCRQRPDQPTPRRRQAFEENRLGRLHGSFLARSAPQPTTARPSRPARGRLSTCTTTGRPCASPSLRSTSASAWAALSTQPDKQRLPVRPSPYRSVSAPAPAGLMREA